MGPDPTALHPSPAAPSLVYLAPLVRARPPIEVGNLARVVRTGDAPSIAARLFDVAWWDWPVDKLTEHLSLIRRVDLDGLEKVA